MGWFDDENWADDKVKTNAEVDEELGDDVAQSIRELAKSTEKVANEIHEFREDLKEDWLRILVQGKVTEEGKIRYDMKW